MNILLIKHFCVGFMVSEIPRVSVFGHCPYSVTFPYIVYMQRFFQGFAKSLLYQNDIVYVNLSVIQTLYVVLFGCVYVYTIDITK